MSGFFYYTSKLNPCNQGGNNDSKETSSVLSISRFHLWYGAMEGRKSVSCLYHGFTNKANNRK